ncbi:MAG: serine/threonine-protein phosphatase, partial [Lachnospiraceae bacterium]|nr:serine/threonine-protein phosphatase [Lachnospiraceae bacterium]
NALVQADFFELRMQKGDILLMCTDGLINMVEDEDIFDIVKQSMDIEVAGKELVRVANTNGGKDNIGIVLVEI